MDGGLLSLKWNNHRSSFLLVLSSLRKKDLYTDVTIACGGKLYRSHKLVLSTCSEYFQEMFQHIQCKHPIIVLKDINCEDLEALLNYMYLGEVNVVQDKLSSLIKAAECLKIKGLAVSDDPVKEDSVEKRNIIHAGSSESKRRRRDIDSNNQEFKYKNQIGSSNCKRSSISQFSTEEYILPGPVQILKDNENHLISNLPKENMYINSKIKLEPIDIIEVDDGKEGILPTDNCCMTYNSKTPPLENNTQSNIVWRAEKDNFPDYTPTYEDNISRDIETSPNDEEYKESSFGVKQWLKRKTESNSSVLSPTDEIQTIADSLPKGMKTYCSTSTSDPISMYQSVQSSNNPVIRVYPCNVCEKLFNHKGDFIKHLRTHTGERPFKCLICSFSSAQKGNLHSHMKRIHPTINSPLFFDNE